MGSIDSELTKRVGIGAIVLVPLIRSGNAMGETDVQG